MQDSQPGEVDLHGLYVKEAIRYTEKSIEEARGRGDREIRLIVGALGSKYARLAVSQEDKTDDLVTTGTRQWM